MAADPAPVLDPSRLYEKDYYAWTREQAEALRRLAAGEAEVAIDFENLIEQVEGLGEADVRTVQSQLRRVMLHLLKLEYSPSPRPRRQWINSVVDARAEIDLYMTASLRHRVEPAAAHQYERARRLAAGDLAEHSENAAAQALPETLPYTLDQLLDEEWYPANRHGLVDEELW